MNLTNIFDTHFHLYEEDDASEIIMNAESAGVSRLMCIGTDFESSLRAQHNAEKFSNMFFSAGVHPHDAEKFDGDYDAFQEFYTHEKSLALGEIGLDYFYDFADQAKQKDVFSEFLKISYQTKLPAVIHCRESFEDCYSFIKKYLKEEQSFIIHCFTGNRYWAEKFVELGGYISYSGIATFKTALDLRESLQVVPKDKILIETDSPYLAPVPLRGKRNQPAYIVHTAKKIAEELLLTPQELVNLTTNNALRVLNIKM